MKDDVILHIFHLDTLDEVWNAQKELYKFARIARRLFLKNEFYKMNMQETSSMVNFLFIVKNLLGQIIGVSDVTKDEDVILIVPNVLSDSYENFMKMC